MDFCPSTARPPVLEPNQSLRRWSAGASSLTKTVFSRRTFVKPDHPILVGVKEFESSDETYVHDLINDEGRTLVAERVDGDHREPWTWVREEGKGRVFYTASGHDEGTWNKTDFITMIRNAIVWTAGDKVKSQWEAFLAQREPENRRKDGNVANYEKRPEPITFQQPFSVKGSMERTQVPADMHLECSPGNRHIQTYCICMG